jgi:phytoene desaturase
MKKALIVGSGLGGITTALRLAKNNIQVEMVEKHSQPGGRLNQIQKDGFTFDMGPSFFSMSYEFDEFANYCGIDLPFEFVELDPLYSVYISNREKPFTIYKNLSKLAGEFRDIEPDFERKMRKYLDSAAQFFHDTEQRVIKKNYDTILGYLLALTSVPVKHTPKMLRSVWKELERHFESHEVKMIFSLVAFFLGATPFDTPAVYSLLSYTELEHDGYYNVRGGMYNIVKGLLKLMEQQDIKIHYDTEIVDYKANGKTIDGFIDRKGRTWQADMYIVNSDAAWFRGKVFKRKSFSDKKLDGMHWTLAPYTMYLGIDGKVDNIQHHNYFLGTNFEDYANKIFKNSISLEKPYYYVNALSKFNPESAPEGCENLFILCPVPDLRYKPDWSDREELAANIIRDLSSRIGFDVKSKIISKTILDPTDWAKMLNLYKGSGLGLAHDLNQIGGFRPKNFDEQFKNVFYVGASTVPGTGLPMVIISSKLVVERILEQYG